MKKTIFLLTTTLLLAACSPTEETVEVAEPTSVAQTSTPVEEEVAPVTEVEVEPEEVEEVAEETTLTTEEVIAAFQTAGLEVGGTPEVGREDFGMAPYVGEKAVRLLIPSLGEDAGGRVFEIDNPEDRELLKNPV